MAEVTAILAFAQTGFKLSITLFSFAQAIGSAGKEIVQTGKDISLFSSVLRQLGLTMQRGHKAGLISNEAFETTAQIVKECKSIFGALEALIQKATTTETVKVVKMEENMEEAKEIERDSLTVSYGRRLLYLFQKSEILNQKRELESLKSSLQLMLSITLFTENKLHFDKEEQSSNSIDTWMADEKLGLESLVLANQAATAEYRKQSTKLQKPYSTFKTTEILTDKKITSSGIIGQLSSKTSDVTTDWQTPSTREPELASLATSSYPAESYSSPASTTSLSPEKTSLFGSITRSKNLEPSTGFVVAVPSLTYDLDGKIAPYLIDASRIALPLEDPSVLPSVKKSPSSSFDQSEETGTRNYSPTASVNTPGAAVNLLLCRMTTQRGQKPSKPSSESDPSIVREQSQCSPNRSGNTTQETDNLRTPRHSQQSSPKYSSNRKDLPLPPGWEKRSDTLGRSYYVDHNSESTSWEWPSASNSSYEGSQDSSNLLPEGWTTQTRTDGSTFYVNQSTCEASWERPVHLGAEKQTASDMPKKHASYQSRSNVPPAPTIEEVEDDSEEPIIDLFPRREARPY